MELQQIYNLLLVWFASWLLFRLFEIVHKELVNIRRFFKR